MKKKLFASCVALMLILATVSPALAAYPDVLDNADILTDSQEATLSTQIAEVSSSVNTDVVVITTDESYSGSRDNYLEDVYYTAGYGSEGIVLHIDMYDRNVAVQVFGDIRTQMDYDDQDALCDIVWDDMLDGNYYEATLAFAKNVPAAMNGTVRFGLSFVELIIVIPLSIVIFCGIFFGVKHSYGSEGKDKPYPFAERATNKFVTNTDNYIREYTTSVRIQSSSGGGGASRSSGRSSRSSSRRF